jgi:hypothetical protein
VKTACDQETGQPFGFGLVSFENESEAGAARYNLLKLKVSEFFSFRLSAEKNLLSFCCPQYVLHFIVLVMLDCKHFMLMLGHMCNSLLDIWG